MKLNKKGYLLVEIIVASVLAMTMMYFLMEITIKLKNMNEDYYVETKLETDKVLMMKNLMEDVSKNELNRVVSNGNIAILSFNQNDPVKKFETKISITKEGENNIFRYGKIDNSNNYDANVYVKTLDRNLNIGTINISCTNESGTIDCNTITKGYLNISIAANTIYSDKDYGININIPISPIVVVN